MALSFDSSELSALIISIDLHLLAWVFQYFTERLILLSGVVIKRWGRNLDETVLTI